MRSPTDGHVEEEARQGPREAHATKAVLTDDSHRQEGPREGGVGGEWDEEVVEDSRAEDAVTEADSRQAAPGRR